MQVKTTYWRVSHTLCGWSAWPISVWVSQLCQRYCNTSSWHKFCSSIICECFMLIDGILRPCLCLYGLLRVPFWLVSIEEHPDCHVAGVHSCAGLVPTLYYANYGHDWISGQHQPRMSALLKLNSYMLSGSRAPCMASSEPFKIVFRSLCHRCGSPSCWLLLCHAYYTRSHFRPLRGQSEDNHDVPMFQCLPWYKHQILDRQWTLKYNVSFLQFARRDIEPNLKLRLIYRSIYVVLTAFVACTLPFLSVPSWVSFSPMLAVQFRLLSCGGQSAQLLSGRLLLQRALQVWYSTASATIRNNCLPALR